MIQIFLLNCKLCQIIDDVNTNTPEDPITSFTLSVDGGSNQLLPAGAASTVGSNGNGEGPYSQVTNNPSVNTNWWLQYVGQWPLGVQGLRHGTYTADISLASSSGITLSYQTTFKMQWVLESVDQDD